jgi:hypothetical protein
MPALSSLYRHDGWNIGLIRGDARSLLDGPADPVWLKLDRGQAFAADPFLIEDAGRLYCFFELLPYATNRGRICYCIIDDPTSSAIPIHDAIVTGYHLSYPSLLRYDGEILCIPEAGESGNVTAYSARSFPDEWSPKHTLLDDFPGLDPTVFEYDGRWWMLATGAGAQSNSDLYVFYAESLFGRWRAHAANPVKRTLNGSRPAGMPFTVDGRLYRPAQDCTVHYGARLVINEILELSPAHFREAEVAVLEPRSSGPFPDGLHTANVAGKSIVIDGNRFHFVRQEALRAVGRRLAKIARRA